MKAKINQKIAESAEPKDKPYEIVDTDLKGFLLRVQPSGVRSFVVAWGRGKRKTLGKYPVMTAASARAAALAALSEAAEHGKPLVVIEAEKPKDEGALTLAKFIAPNGRYTVWAEQNIARFGENTKRVSSVFAPLMDIPMEDIEKGAVEEILTNLIRSGKTPATANRAQASLRGVLKKAVDWKVIEAHPLQGMSIARVTTGGVVRYLTNEEAARLRGAIDERERERRDRRERGNVWKSERAHAVREVWPEWGFTDYLAPIVLLALNTGLRRGELLQLTWDNVKLDLSVLIVAADTAKSSKARHLPLNNEALDVLTRWRRQNSGGGLVFGGSAGGLQSIKKSWAGLLARAEIEGFRFHDLRHDFASKLVMAGVDLNTVRELLGHADLKMTLRYAHLAPQTLANAVAKLGR